MRYLFDEIFYRFQLGYIAKSSIPPNIEQDILNPSQLPNIQTDVLSYYQERNITIDELLLRKNWNLGCGVYGRLSTGLFTQFYGGFAGEILYYPLHSCWALGAEVAKLYKRNIKGASFSKTIRKFDGTNVTYIDFDGMQYFLDGYYIWKEADIDLKVSVGRFLAGDKGARFEVARTYASEPRLYAPGIPIQMATTTSMASCTSIKVSDSLCQSIYSSLIAALKPGVSLSPLG